MCYHVIYLSLLSCVTSPYTVPGCLAQWLTMSYWPSHRLQLVRNEATIAFFGSNWRCCDNYFPIRHILLTDKGSVTASFWGGAGQRVIHGNSNRSNLPITKDAPLSASIYCFLFLLWMFSTNRSSSTRKAVSILYQSSEHKRSIWIWKWLLVDMI